MRSVETGSPPSLATTLPELKAAWQNHFERRASGGWWALSGFSLQMLATLERFLKRELIDGAPRGERDIEAVSDALIGEDKLVFIQIKRRLTPQTLEAAFAEAYDIASLCSDVLRSQMRFQIVTMVRDANTTLDKPLAMKALRKRSQVDGALVDRTLAMFDAENAILVSADPEHALCTVLWNAGVENPAETLQKMLGRIVVAFDGADRAGVQRALFDALDFAHQAARHPPRSIGQFYLPGDLSIASPASSNAIIGSARPRLPELQMGRYLERGHILDNVVRQARGWCGEASALAARQIDQLPVFCIRGRSGDGKSVLLLQLVSALVESRALPMITGLASFDDVEAWLASRPLVAVGDDSPGIEFAFIDDIGKHGEAARWREMIETQFALGSPCAALITCGATEAVAPKELPGFDLRYFEMPPPSQRDYAMFERHFGTGKAIAPAFDAGVSLTAMLLSLREGAGASDARLADQLREALRAQGVWPAARHIAAANLLETPGAAPQHLTQSIAAFEFDRDPLSLRVSLTEGGFELSHVDYLAKIYPNWREDAADPHSSWGTDLGAALATALHSGQIRLARRLLGQLVDLAGLRKRLGRLPRGEAERGVGVLLEAAFAELTAQADDVTLAPLMRQWLVARRARGVSFATTLGARATALLTSVEVGPLEKAEIAIGLSNERQIRDTASRAQALAYLEGVTNPPLVVDHFARLATNAGEENDARVASWLNRHGRSPAAAPVLAAAVRRDSRSGYRGGGFALAGRHPNATGVSDLIWALVQEPVEPMQRDSLDRWLEATGDDTARTRTYTQLLKLPGASRYRSRARRWLETQIEQGGTHDLLHRLITTGPPEDLTELIQRWLALHPYDEGRYTVVGAMLSRPHLAAVGLRIALGLLADGRNPHTGYLFSQAWPIVQTMSAHEVYALTRSLPKALHRPLAALLAKR